MRALSAANLSRRQRVWLSSGASEAAKRALSLGDGATGGSETGWTFARSSLKPRSDGALESENRKLPGTRRAKLAADVETDRPSERGEGRTEGCGWRRRAADRRVRESARQVDMRAVDASRWREQESPAVQGGGVVEEGR